jgi:hypothetical protein
MNDNASRIGSAMLALDEILLKYFGCKKPFLKKRRVVGHWSDGEPDYEYMTRAGGRVYEKLVKLIGDIGILTENMSATDHVVGVLDQIVRGDR